MKVSRKRLAVALCLSLFGGLLATSATPAAAAEADAMASCITILQSSPTLGIDVDGDGNPDVSLPRIYDVELCQEHGTSFQVYEPTWSVCQFGGKPRCVMLHVTVLPVSAGAYAEAELCYSVTGLGRTCIPVPPVHVVGASPTTMCIGFDPFGGPNPCSA